jgi:hypothetical protein
MKERTTSREQLEQLAPGGYLFAIVDPCETPEILEKTAEIGSKAIPLFQGTRYEHYTSVSPYLVSVDPQVCDWIFVALRDTCWGIFLLTKANAAELYQHFQQFLSVQLPDGSVCFFRYYDPRILKVYLRSCNVHELAEFFGPVRGFGILEERGIHVFEHEAEKQCPSPGANVLRRIRPDQYQSFEYAAEEEFRKRVMRFVAANVPEALSGAPPERFTAAIDDGIAKARQYGMTWESSIVSFVTALFEVSPVFDHYPPFRVLLVDSTIDPNEKMERLIEFAKDADWKAASTVGRHRA